MTDFDHSPLADRLRRVVVTLPDPKGVHAYALQPRRTRRGWPFAVAVGAMAAALLFVGVPALSPNVASIYADSPVVSALLRMVALDNVVEHVAGGSDRSLSAGVVVELTGAYADANRTVILVKTPPGVIIDTNSVTLRDQFGTALLPTGSIADRSSGEQALLFGPLPWPSSHVG